MLASALQERGDPCRGSCHGQENERAAMSLAAREAEVQISRIKLKKPQANKKPVLWLQPGTQDSKQRRLESQHILPWGNQLCLGQRGKK